MEVIEGISRSDYKLDINPKIVCRLCLSQASNLQNIFSNSIVDGYIISIPDMLSFTVDITVTTDDKLPSKICIDCKNQIVTFYTFKQKTKRTEQSLNSMLSTEINTVQECGAISVSDGMASIQHVQQDNHDLGIFELDNTSEEIIKMFSEGQEIRLTDFQTGNAENKAFETSDDLKKHLRSVCIGKRYECHYCNVSFQTYDDLRKHLRIDCVEKNYECNECDRKFNSKMALDKHLKLIGNKKFECKTCTKSFKKQRELTIHMRSHTNERPFKCTICEKSYKTSSMRSAHMDTHINGKTFECIICNKKLQSRVTYRAHMNRHTQEKRHDCGNCSKRFFTKYALKSHMKIHKEIATKQICDDGFNILNDEDFAKLINDDEIMNCYLKFTE